MISFNKTCYMGKERSGKTLSLVADGYDTLLFIRKTAHNLKEKQKKKKLNSIELQRLKIMDSFELWSNLKLNKRIYGDYKIITVDKIKEMYEQKIIIEHKLLLLDDIFKDLDALNFAREKNKIVGYFMTEIGKKQNIVRYVSHFSRKVELRLKELTEFFVRCRRGKYKKLKYKNKFIDLWIEDKDYFKLELEPSELKKMIIEQTYYTDYIDFSQDYAIPKRKIVKKTYINGFNFFKHYDTGEVI